MISLRPSLGCGYFYVRLVWNACVFPVNVVEVCIVAPFRWFEEDLTTPTLLLLSSCVCTGMAAESRCAKWILFCCSSSLV